MNHADGPVNVDNKLKCPSCGSTIPLSDDLIREIQNNYQKETDDALVQYKNKLDQEYQEKLSSELNRQESEIKENLTLEMQDLKNQVAEKDLKVIDFQQKELELRKQQRELEDRQKSQEIEIARKLDEEKEKLYQSVRDTLLEQHRLTDAQKDKQLEDQKKLIEELKRKSEQGSQQLQGEVQELILENELKMAFPVDQIESVGKALNGADVVQKVFSKNGQLCGSIIWESKNTKNWSNGWITKLKDDQRAISADLAIIVTRTLPDSISGFSLLDGVWVTDLKNAIPLAMVLATSLQEVYKAKASVVGKNEKMEILFSYFTGPQFKQRVEVIAESFKIMKKDLEDEKAAYAKMWAKRENQIRRVIENTAGMYGDVQGLTGTAMPQIESMELAAIAEEPEF